MADLELNGIERMYAVEEDTRPKGMAALHARPSNQYRYEHYDPR